MIANEWQLPRSLCFILMLIIPALGIPQEDVEKSNDAIEKPPIFDTMELLTEQLRPFNVKAVLDNGVAVLIGTVNNTVEKDLAEAIARSVEGVNTINSQIKVKTARGEEKSDTPDEIGNNPNRETNRSINAWVQDYFIYFKVKLKLLLDPAVSGFRIHVDVLNGVITLSGNINSHNELRLAKKLSKDTHGVLKVRNETNLKDRNPSLMPARSNDKIRQKTANTKEIINDGWITAKIKSAFIAGDDLQTENINVDTKNGVVFLSGRIENITQKELAIETARSTEGVKEVQSLLRLSEEQ